MPGKPLLSIWLGFDPREASAFAVARHSCRRHLNIPIPIHGIVLGDLQEKGLYTRPTTIRHNAAGHVEMIDHLSVRPDYDGRISTEHAIARFLTPHLAKSGWALFADGDVLFRGNVGRMLEGLDTKKAIYCVKHDHLAEAGVKMDSQVQTQYARKNWSSFVVWNVDHPANKALTLEMVNTLPGRDLHRFAWLDDDEIGALDPSWNFLVGHTDPQIVPKVAHFTLGLPDMDGYYDCAFADEWRRELTRWAV
jgi:hypothetical protein